MLSRANRLTDNKDFQNVYRRGRFSSTALVSVNVLPNHTDTTKIGVVASKKVAKKAHNRNKLKRQVREIMRAKLARLAKGMNIIISIRPAALGKDFENIEKELFYNLKKLGLFDETTKRNN